MRNRHLDRDVLERAEHLYRTSSSLAKQGSAKANTFIHSQPILSTLLGVGIGFLVGMTLRGRK